jgi:hypothetical protein
MINIQLEPFSNSDKPVIISKLFDLSEKCKELFIAVVAHGSVGSNEIIPYSDFDGLIVVKDEFKDSQLLKDFIEESKKEIVIFDPLQHHGWFLMYESQLKCYPQNYLPFEVLNCSKLIYPNSKVNLSLKIDENVDYKVSYFNLQKGIRRKLDNINKVRTAFQLKGFISQVLLLPAVFLAAKYGNGIDKKQSFELIKNEFSITELFSINCASEIRLNWDYKVSNLQSYLLQSEFKIVKELMRRYLSTKINGNHKQVINSLKFKQGLELILKKMENEIN